MTRTVLYFLFQPLDRVPPCIAQICALHDMGIRVAVLCGGCGEPTRQLLRQRVIPCHTFQVLQNRNRLVQKGRNFFNYRRAVRGFLKQYWSDSSVLWMGTEESAIKMWPFVRNVHPCVLNALEFFEADWYQKAMKKISHKVDILTACQNVRANYMMDWWHLERRPYLLWNKPYSVPPARGAGSTPELRAAIEKLRGKKVLLYQGNISANRNLTQLAQALREMDSDFFLAMAGWAYEDGVKDLSDIYPNTLYLGYFPAPSHLELTSYATVAVAFYQDNCINNRYCAPNKIYEYAAYGIPMLCNTVPGLTDTVGRAGAAECVDFGNPAQVKAALNRIEAGYDAYRQAALAFYENTDNTPVIRQIVEDAFSRTKAAKP